MYHSVIYFPGWHGGPAFPFLIARNSQGGMSLLLTATRRLIKENFGVCNVHVMATNPSYSLYGAWQFNESKKKKYNTQWGKSRWLHDHVSGFAASVLQSILHMGACHAQLPIEVMLIAHLLLDLKEGLLVLQVCMFIWLVLRCCLTHFTIIKAPEDCYRPFTY